MSKTNETIFDTLRTQANDAMRNLPAPDFRYGLYTRFTDAELPTWPTDIAATTDATTDLTEKDIDIITDLFREYEMTSMLDAWRIASMSTRIVRVSGTVTVTPTAKSEAIIILTEEGSDVQVTIEGNDTTDLVSVLVLAYAAKGTKLTVTALAATDDAERLTTAIGIADTDATIEWTELALAGRYLRNHGKTVLRGDRAKTHIRSAAFADGNEVMDIRHTVRHAADATTSDIASRIALAGDAKVSYRGLAKMERGLKALTGMQSEATLMLSDKAEMHAQPDLEIGTDDVVASHAASVGTLDDEKRFYLVSRGITPKDADRMIVEGFLMTMADTLDDGIKERVMTAIETKTENLA